MAVDATDLGAQNRFVASGLLHGVKDTTTPDYATFVQPLNIQNWRLSASGLTTGQPATWSYLQANGATIPNTTSLVSDSWHTFARQPANFLTNCFFHKRARNPWNNWGFFNTWLTNLANGEIAAGREPTHWDLMNEVHITGTPFFSTKYSSDPAITVDDLLFPNNALCRDRITAAKLHSYVIDATTVLHGLGQEVVAGSWSQWNWMTALGIDDPYIVNPPPPALPFDPIVNLDGMLSAADGAGVVLDGVSYHELNAGSPNTTPPGFRGSPRARFTNASQVRAVLALHPNQAPDGIFINEYTTGTGPNGDWSAGGTASHVWGITLADPTEANRTCNISSDCGAGGLDGLITYDAMGNPQKRVSWYVFQAYGQMTGDFAETASNERTFTGLSTYDATADVVRILLGRYDNGAARAAADAKVELTAPAGWTSGSYQVSITQIGDSTGGTAAASPPPTTVCDVMPDPFSGIAEIPIDQFPDAYAYSLRVEQSAGGNPAC